MIGLLKSNLLVSPFVLFILAFLIRIKALISPVSYQLVGNEGPFYKMVHSLIQNPYVESIFVTLLIFIQAYFINRLVLRHSLMRPPNFLTAFFFIILASLSTHFLGFHPVILANVFVILALSELFKIYKLHKSAIHIFNAGFLLAIAGLIYFPIFLFYFACSIIILVLRSYDIIERLQLFLGFITPVYLIGIYFYLNDQLTSFWDSYINISFQLPDFDGISRVDSYTLIIFAVIILFCIINYRNFIIKKGIEIQKKIDGLFWLMFFGFLTIFFAQPLDPNHLILIALPLASFLSMFVLNIKQNIFAELIGLIFLILTPLLHFGIN